MEQNPQLTFPIYKSFRNAQKQHVHGAQFLEVEPVVKSDTQYEFEITGNEPLAFGVATGFRVEGKFEMLVPKAGEVEAHWAPLTKEQGKKISMVQNWFDHYIKNSIEVFHVNNNVTQDDVPPNITAGLNSFLLAHMHPDVKDMLCMEKCHPGHAVSHDHGNFKTAVGDNVWTRYLDHICKDKIEFVYTPLNKWPFYQDCNYTHGEDGGFTIVPISQLGRLHVRVFFKEDSSVLFNKPQGHTYSYRFVLTKFTLLLKELRVSPSYSRSLNSMKGTITYRGLTKIGICENLTAANFSHRATIPNVHFPEGIFIYCINKKVISGTAVQQEMSIDGPFLQHNIATLDVHFNGQHFFIKQPTFGSLANLQLRREKYQKWKERGCMGFKFDPKIVTWEKHGVGRDLAYDNVWVDFTEENKWTRLQTVPDNNFITNKMGDLTVILNFHVPEGATDASYIIIIYYTDYALNLDMKNKRFSAVYNRNTAIN